MKIPVGMTYGAHAVLALVLLVLSTLTLSMDLGWTSFDLGQAYGAVLGMLSIIPLVISLLIASYSAVAAIVTLLRRQHVPREMLLLPIGLLVLIGGGMGVSSFDTRWSKVVSYLFVAVYVSLTLVLASRYRSGRRRSG